MRRRRSGSVEPVGVPRGRRSPIPLARGVPRLARAAGGRTGTGDGAIGDVGSGSLTDRSTHLYAIVAALCNRHSRPASRFLADASSRLAAGRLARSAASRRAGSTSSQFGPAARSTFSGTSRSSAAVIASRTSVGQRGDLLVGGLEDQLVVDLEEHPRLEPSLAEPAVDREHGPLDQVGGRALDHGVDRRPLGQVADPAGRVLDPVDRPAAAEDRLDPAGRLRRFERPGDERVDPGVLAGSRRR